MYLCFLDFSLPVQRKTAARHVGTMSADDYEAWKEQHKPDCCAISSGSAPAMKSAAAVKLWSRRLSVDRRSLRFVEYIGDGDCRGHSNVVAAASYGPDVNIVKLECIGHVQKRVGSRLRELVKKHSGKKLSDWKAN